MKKALLLGAVAFLAINIATVQTVNAQGEDKVEGKPATEKKVEKKVDKERTATTAKILQNPNAQRQVKEVTTKGGEKTAQTRMPKRINSTTMSADDSKTTNTNTVKPNTGVSMRPQNPNGVRRDDAKQEQRNANQTSGTK